MRERVDVAIIGAGGAGYPAAFLLDRAGRRVMMVDPIGNLGGDCLAEGCVPSKAVREGALSYQRGRRGPLSGVTGLGGETTRTGSADRQSAGSTWRGILNHKDEVQQLRYEQHRHEIEASSVRFMTGRARVVSESEIDVGGGSSDGARFVFEHLVLATGSSPSRLPLPGAELAVTSHDLFRIGAEIDLPEQPIIIGGGYIGVETATILEHLGAAPVVLELTDQVLPGFDHDVARFLESSLAERVRIELGKAVTEIERSGSGFVVRYRHQRGVGADVRAENGSVEGDLVIMATGRVPVMPEGIEHLDIALDRHGGPRVDARLRTTNPSVWAPGDVNAKSMLFHSAVRQSIVVAHDILAGGASADRMDFSSVPITVFTDPEISSVGLSEAQAIEQNGEVAVGTYDYALDARAQILGETRGYLKLIFDAHSARLLGAQVAGIDAAQLVAPLALALNQGLGARALAEVAFPHPMISEGINKAARQILV